MDFHLRTTFFARLVVLATLALSATAKRMANVAMHNSGDALFALEAQAAKRTAAAFREAFPESFLEESSSACPYGTEEESLKGGASPFTCHYHLPEEEGRGSTCPELQQRRLKVARKFIASQYGAFVHAATDFPLAELFDKSSLMIGDETYENMVHYHIEGLMNPDIVRIEDKIKLKELSNELGVPSTTMYFGTHKDEWDDDLFAKSMQALCGQGVDDMIIKATHMAWSEGMKIVRGWQNSCEQPGTLQGNITELANFITGDILSKVPRESDAHLNYLRPGVTVEELFKTGGESRIPLEAKVQVIWGKVHQIFFIGQDNRGCQVGSGSWNIYGDRSGWDLGGMTGTTPMDDSNKVFMEKYFDKVVNYAEVFAKGIGADYTRVDFFLGDLNEEGEPLIQLNEAETVSGYKYAHERFGIGSVWRDGYVVRDDGIRVSPDKWEMFMGHMQDDRDANHLD